MATRARVVGCTVSGILAIGTVCVTPTALAAQNAPTGRVLAQATPRTMVWIRETDPCADTSGEVRDLSRWPEGLAIVRMRRDLDVAQRLAEVSGRSAAASDAQAIVMLQREVESLASTLARAPQPASSRARTQSVVTERQEMLGRVRALSSDVNALVERTVRATPAAASAPRGYMGVTLSSASVRDAMQGGYAVSYCAYPVVEAVDPGSPAERAGLAAGDTVVSFDGRDLVAAMVDYSALLEPGRTVRVGVRRAGRVRHVGVAVVPRTTQGVTVRSFSTVRRFNTEPSVGFSPMAPPGAVMGTSVLATPAPTPTALRLYGRVGAGPLTTVNGADDAMFGGAQLKTLSAELRTALGQPEGVLVLDVLLGTPASDGGLRAGDIIRAANGMDVRRVLDVLRAFEQVQAARALPLRVVRRDAAERTVMMRW